MKHRWCAGSWAAAQMSLPPERPTLASPQPHSFGQCAGLWQCFGTVAYLWQCSHSGWFTHKLWAQEDVGVICSLLSSQHVLYAKSRYTESVEWFCLKDCLKAKIPSGHVALSSFQSTVHPLSHSILTQLRQGCFMIPFLQIRKLSFRGKLKYLHQHQMATIQASGLLIRCSVCCTKYAYILEKLP